jgi:hypothetical protein
MRGQYSCSERACTRETLPPPTGAGCRACSCPRCCSVSMGRGWPAALATLLDLILITMMGTHCKQWCKQVRAQLAGAARMRRRGATMPSELRIQGSRQPSIGQERHRRHARLLPLERRTRRAHSRARAARLCGHPCSNLLTTGQTRSMCPTTARWCSATVAERHVRAWHSRSCFEESTTIRGRRFRGHRQRGT